MIHETFVSSNPKSAYALAVEKYGKTISLVSAKQIRYDDDVLRSEITVSIPKNLYEEISLGKVHEEENDEGLEFEIRALKEQLDVMKSDMHKEIQEANPVVSKIKNMFISKGISATWLDNLLQTLMGSEIIEDEKLLLMYILEEIDVSLKIKAEDLSRPKIVMLVGPTGVGKTTTIAKLAARYVYMLDKSYSVALINLDSYKIAAVEQLGYYADVMQIDHRVVNNVLEFEEALEAFVSHDIILVDTAGMSPYDTEKFIETIEFIKTDAPRDIEVSLLLPATVKYEDMQAIYQNFSFLHLESLLISKFDETRHFGTLLNFMLEYDLPMEYFSTGQEVPDDLVVASKEFLLEHFIGEINQD